MSSEDVASSPHVSPFYTHTDYLHNDLQGFYSCWGSSSLDSSILHGLSAQQVPRQQRIDWGGTTHDPAFLRIWGSPQAGILLHAAPQQLSACLCSAATAAVAAAAVVVVVPVGRVADWMGGSGPGPAHPSLIGAWSSLPAGGSTKQLALCKEAINILFPGKLCQDGGVPEHAPAQRQGSRYTGEEHLKKQLELLKQLVRKRTCAGTSEPWQLHPWSCSAPQRCPVSG